MKILIGSGGTGGHIYPALAFANYIIAQDSNNQVVFIGTEKGMESRIIPLSGFTLLTINARGFNRGGKSILPFIKELKKGIRQSKKIIDDFQPDVVIGTGGYVSAPLVLASIIKRIPTVLHEQNVIPGLANRFLAPWAKAVCVSFVQTSSKFLVKRNVRLTGNPRASEVYNLVLDKKNSRKNNASGILLVVYGGSHGSLKINSVIAEYIMKNDLPQGTEMVFVTGERYYKNIMEKVSPVSGKVKIEAYLDNMPEVLARAGLVITRSGATTIAEISALGIPAILIPSPNVANNEQYFNARALSDCGAAVMIEEKDLSEGRLKSELLRLINNPELLDEMSIRSREIGMPEASQNLYQCMKEVAS